MQIELNKFEVIVAGHIGMLRNAEASINKRAVRFPEKKVGELWGNHIESAMSEMAVSKYLGIYWGFGVNTFHVSDIINTELEIRWSSREDVKIRPDDTGIIVSVTGKCPTYELKGWIPANEGKLQIYRYDVDPVCYFVPHYKLKPIKELKDYIIEKNYLRQN